MSEAFAICDGRGDDRVARTVLELAGRQAYAQKSSQNVVSVFLIRRKQTELSEKLEIAKSIPHFGIIVHNIRRDADDDFYLLGRDQLQSFAAAVIFCGRAFVIGLPENVVSEFFFQAWSGGGDRRDPVRLLCLRLIHAFEPIGKVTPSRSGTRLLRPAGVLLTKFYKEATQCSR